MLTHISNTNPNPYGHAFGGPSRGQLREPTLISLSGCYGKKESDDAPVIVNMAATAERR